MTLSRSSTTLSVALHKKLVVDMHLLKLQQDMQDGKQVFSASAMLSALEDCDEAIEVVWHELGYVLRDDVMAVAQIEAVPIPSAEHVPAYANAMLVTTQQRILQFFQRTQKPDSPLNPSGL